MKYIDKFGRTDSEEINELIFKIEQLVKPLFESVSPIEAFVLSGRIEGAISYQASVRCVREIMKEED